MANKLKNIQLTSVDLVRAGANQEADICLFKSAAPPGKPELLKPPKLSKPPEQDDDGTDEIDEVWVKEIEDVSLARTCSKIKWLRQKSPTPCSALNNWKNPLNLKS